MKMILEEFHQTFYKESGEWMFIDLINEEEDVTITEFEIEDLNEVLKIMPEGTRKTDENKFIHDVEFESKYLIVTFFKVYPKNRYKSPKRIKNTVGNN